MTEVPAPAVDDLCVVVGASGAVGSAVVRRLIGAGRRVLAVARRAEGLETLRAELRSQRLTTCVTDLSSDDAVPTLAEAVDGPVALALFAAGLPVLGSMEVAEPAALAGAYDIKVGGMIRLLRALEPRLVPGSRVVAVAGSLGLEPGPHDAAPGTVNAALLNLMRQASQLYGPRGVVTTTLMLGPLDTPRLRAFAVRRAEESGSTPEEVLAAYASRSSLGRLPTPADVAWLVETLLAPEARLLHGSAIGADAGARHVIL